MAMPYETGILVITDNSLGENLNISVENEDISSITVITEDVTVITEERVEVVTVEKQGPPGPTGATGAQGPRGVTNFVVNEEEYLFDSGFQYSYTLSESPVEGSVQVFLNGLRQSQTNYEVVVQPSGSTVILQPSSGAYPGDVVTINYFAAR
jgi:hypothetical protein